MKERKRTSKNGKREKRKRRPTLQNQPTYEFTLFYDSILLEVKNLSWDSSENEWILNMKRKKEIDIIINFQNDFAFLKTLESVQ